MLRESQLVLSVMVGQSSSETRLETLPERQRTREAVKPYFLNQYVSIISILQFPIFKTFSTVHLLRLLPAPFLHILHSAVSLRFEKTLMGLAGRLLNQRSRPSALPQMKLCVHLHKIIRCHRKGSSVVGSGRGVRIHYAWRGFNI